jgi:hypothetical protein
MYTEPGSGLFFLQVLAAALLTVGYRFRRAVSSILRNRRKNDSDPGS